MAKLASSSQARPFTQNLLEARQNLNLNFMAFTYSVFLAIMLVFFDWVLAQKFRYFEQAKQIAAQERASMATFARLGLAVNAVTLDVRGRLALQRGLLGRLDLSRYQASRSPDGGDTLKADEVSRIKESHQLMEKSLVDLEGFTLGLRSRLEDNDHQPFDLCELVRDLVGSTNTALGTSISVDLPQQSVRWVGQLYPTIQILENTD
jgi:hypothetical protein